MRNTSIRTGLKLLASVSLACFVTQSAMAAPGSRGRAERRAGMLRAVGGGHEVLPVAGEGGPLPDRARQRLHRQHLAHPDDPDGEGLCRAAGGRRQAQGVQGRLDRRGRAAQISAINNFIDSGYDAIVVNAQNPTAFGPVIKRAKEAGVVLVAFDNILDTEDAINVNVDQKGLGELLGQLAGRAHSATAARSSRCAASPAPRSTRDRHDGIHEVLDASGKKWEVVEVIGKWDDGTAQKVTADAIAVQQAVRRHHRAGRRHRRRAGDDRRRASVRAVRRRDRERLPQVLRRARRPRA